MKPNSRHVAYALLAAAVAAFQARAQSASPQLTRLTVGFGVMISEPKGEFRSNDVGTAAGAGGTLLYHLDKSGWLSLRFDGSGLSYGSEKKRVPLSPTVGSRILTDVTTTNMIAGLSFGPELSASKGAVRPYLNAAYSGLLFGTTSSVEDFRNSEEHISTTNHSDGAGGWVYGSGVRVPLRGRLSNLSLDFDVRYHRGGQVSYLREGSIQDTPDGSITITPLNSRTPYMAYVIGAQFRIPFNSMKRCPRAQKFS